MWRMIARDIRGAEERTIPRLLWGRSGRCRHWARNVRGAITCEARLRASVENSPSSCHEIFGAVRLRKEAYARCDHAMLDDRVLSEAGDVQDLQARPLGHKPLGELGTVHPGQDDIGEEEVDRRRLGQLDSGGSIRRLEDLEARRFEHPARVAANIGVVLHQHDGLAVLGLEVSLRPEGYPIVWYSPDGREWARSGITKTIRPCPGWVARTDGEITSAATNGRQVVLVGLEYAPDAEACRTWQAAAWVSSDGMPSARGRARVPAGRRRSNPSDRTGSAAT